jgi:hypothetical protein
MSAGWKFVKTSLDMGTLGGILRTRGLLYVGIDGAALMYRTNFHVTFGSKLAE